MESSAYIFLNITYRFRSLSLFFTHGQPVFPIPVVEETSLAPPPIFAEWPHSLLTAIHFSNTVSLGSADVAKLSPCWDKCRTQRHEVVVEDKAIFAGRSIRACISEDTVESKVGFWDH